MIQHPALVTDIFNYQVLQSLLEDFTRYTTDAKILAQLNHSGNLINYTNYVNNEDSLTFKYLPKLTFDITNVVYTRLGRTIDLASSKVNEFLLTHRFCLPMHILTDKPISPKDKDLCHIVIQSYKEHKLSGTRINCDIYLDSSTLFKSDYNKIDVITTFCTEYRKWIDNNFRVVREIKISSEVRENNSHLAYALRYMPKVKNND